MLILVAGDINETVKGEMLCTDMAVDMDMDTQDTEKHLCSSLCCLFYSLLSVRLGAKDKSKRDITSCFLIFPFLH